MTIKGVELDIKNSRKKRVTDARIQRPHCSFMSNQSGFQSMGIEITASRYGLIATEELGPALSLHQCTTDTGMTQNCPQHL